MKIKGFATKQRLFKNLLSRIVCPECHCKDKSEVCVSSARAIETKLAWNKLRETG